jgi:hypothetical protein
MGQGWAGLVRMADFTCFIWFCQANGAIIMEGIGWNQKFNKVMS